MVYITFKRSPMPCKSVRLKTRSPLIDFIKFEEIGADCGFLVFAATPAERIGVAIFNPGLKKASTYFQFL